VTRADRRCLLQQLAFSESRHFSWDNFPANTMAYDNGIQWCPFQYWHFGTLVQYQYGHITLLVLAFNIARTGNDISALWFSADLSTFDYWYWHSKMVPVPVLAFLHFGSVPVQAHSITGTGIQKWCPYQYWHFCFLVQCWYRHSQLPVLAFNNGDHISTVISALWFSTGKGTVHYW
jgi:hypothetical protein